MPQTNNPQPQFTSPIGAPICQACQAPMRLVRTEPYAEYLSVDQLTYACPCGEAAVQFVQR
jgi:hypothetical protein